MVSKDPDSKLSIPRIFLFFFYVSYENSRNEDSPNTPLLYLVKLDGRRKYDRFFDRGGGGAFISPRDGIFFFVFCGRAGVDGEKTWHFFRGDDFTISAPYWVGGRYFSLILKGCMYLTGKSIIVIVFVAIIFTNVHLFFLCIMYFIN